MRQVPEGILKFTLVRNPFDRLASLFANHLDYYPFTAHGIFKDMPLEDFVNAVVATREPLCDHHLWGASHHLPRDTQVFYFEDFNREIDRMNDELGLKLNLRHFGLTKSPKPEFTERQLDALTWRYRHDLERFYENNTDPESCRVRGKTEARLRQGSPSRTDGLDSVRDWPAPTDSPEK